MTKHVIFDCFGTLIDTGKGSIRAVEQILSWVGSDVDPHSFYAEWKKVKKELEAGPIFLNEKKLFQSSLAVLFDRHGIHADAAEAVQPMLRTLFGDRYVFPDTAAALALLDEKRIDYAIGSTTDTDSLLHFLSLNHLSFSRIYTSENMGVYKPAVRFYDTILARTGWDAADCLFVGDNYSDDVCGPKAAGIRAALLDRRGTFRQPPDSVHPDFVIRLLTDLREIV